MAKNNQRDPNLRAVTVARVNQLVKGGMTKAGAFEKISSETGRAKDAVQMLYYRAVRAGAKAPQAGKAVAKGVSPKATPMAVAPAATAAPKKRRRGRKLGRSAGSVSSVSQSGDFPALLSGIANAINNLLKHVEKTVEENKTLKEQSQRLRAITSLIRGR